jgi:hypothetical protein
VYQGDSQVNYNEEESLGLKWVPFEALSDDTTFCEMVKKMQAKLMGI